MANHKDPHPYCSQTLKEISSASVRPDCTALQRDHPLKELSSAFIRPDRTALYSARLCFHLSVIAAPQGAHWQALRHARQHGVLDTRALIIGATRASLTRPTRGALHALRQAHQHGVLDTRALTIGAPPAFSSCPTRGAPACAAACTSARRTGRVL